MCYTNRNKDKRVKTCNYEHDIHLNILPDDGIDPFEFQCEVWGEWADRLIENVTLLATNQ